MALRDVMNIFTCFTGRGGKKSAAPTAMESSLGSVQTASPEAAPLVAERLKTPEFAEDTLTAASRRFMKGLTPERIIAIFDAAAIEIADQIQLAHEFEESDDHLRGTLQLRRAAVQRLEVQVEPGEPDDPASERAAEALRDIVGKPWFHRASEHLLRATFLQWSAVEVFWERGDTWKPCGIRPVECGRFHFTRQRQLQLRKKIWSNRELVSPAAGKYMLHGVDVTAIPGEFAVIRCIAGLTYLGSLDVKQWGTMIDQWGVPVIRLQYADGMTIAQVQATVDEMLSLAGRRVIATKQGTTVDVSDVPEQAPHEAFQNFRRRATSKLLLGQDSSQSAMQGQKTGATLQGEVRDDIRDQDAKLLDASQNESFVTPWCLWNYGPNVKPPRIVRCIRETKDPEQMGRVLVVARDLGMPIMAEFAYRSLGIEQPKDAPEMLFAGVGPASAPAAAGGVFESRGRAARRPFETILQRVQAAADRATSFDDFKRRMTTIVNRSASDPLSDDLYNATFGAYCAGRLDTAAKLTRATALSATVLADINFELSEEGAPLERGRFSEAIDQFAQRNDLLKKRDFLKLKGEARARAWTVARVSELDVLKDLHDAVGQSIEGGESFRDFRDSLNTIMARRGWDGLEPWHAKLVYSQNMAMAHSAGRVSQARDSGVGHWRKLPTDSQEARPEHSRYDGKVFTFEQMTPPPWGFGCKCNWEVVFEDELDSGERVKGGLPPADEPPGGGEFEWNAMHYFRPIELRRGDYPQQYWPLINDIARSTNALLAVRDA